MNIGQVYWQNHSPIPCCDYDTLLALVTLGNMTQMGWFIYVSRHPRMVKANREGCIHTTAKVV
jgi:hypothetical protein